MAKTVVAVVGQNANGILECQSRRFLRLAETMGLQGHVLNLHDPAYIHELDRALQAGILFAWGYAGVGARAAMGGRNIWDATGIPFISVLADAPYIMPSNHHVGSAYVVNGYVYPEWLALQQAHIRSPQICAVLPMGVLPNPARYDVPWSARSKRMLFVKSGEDPAKQRASWSAWPGRLQPVLHDCADVLGNRPPGPILPVVESCLQAYSLALDGCRPLLFGLLHELDSYVRALRATAMARALLPLQVDIVGDGWDHLRHEPARARFHPPIDAAELDGLYADTQILVNVTPNFGSGAHERVLRGFAARSCVLSDNNAHARAHLRHLPSYHGVEWHEPDLADRVAAVFHDPARYDDWLDEGQAYVEEHHNPAGFLQRMIELAQLASMQSVMSGYALHAA